MQGEVVAGCSMQESSIVTDLNPLDRLADVPLGPFPLESLKLLKRVERLRQVFRRWLSGKRRWGYFLEKLTHRPATAIPGLP